MKHSNWIVLAGMLAAFPCAGAQTLVTERTLSLDAALEAASAALAQCRKDGTPVTVTVLDHAGRTKVVLRDDGAGQYSVEHSYRKTYTALSYRMSSAEYGKRAAASFPASAGPLNLPNMTTSGGGLPIRAGNTVVGAIGVSGSPRAQGVPGGARDELCAQAGIDRIAQGLGG
jgi:uncharacterized protein GlcG (DUF336 family)